MKERRIKIIVSIVTLSVIGLIAIQVFWLINVIRIEEERFDRKVNDALRGVAEKIDRDEAAQGVMRKIEHSNRQPDNFKPVKKPKSGVVIRDSIYSIALVTADSSKERDLNFRFDYFAEGKDTAEIRLFRVDSSSRNKIMIGNRVSWKQKIDSFVVKRSQLVEDVVTDIIKINTGKKIEERINDTRLENFLFEELKKNGIETDFYFGVEKPARDTIVLIKEGTDINELKKSTARTLLFPDEIFNRPNQLVVYFPDKNRYLLTSVSGMLVLSIILISIISLLFYKTIQMFIQQKKITEIKNDLINNITHEFKTPISTISVACEALKEPDLVKEQSSVERYRSIIKEENERLSMMVETLLNTAAFEKGSVHISKEEFNLNDAVIKAADSFDEVLKKQNGKIELDLSNENLICNADKFHITNVISNLIDNAIKYNDREPVIRISTEYNEGEITLKISDNGIGINKDHLEKIFETFYRVPTGNIHTVRGNGIGLSYSKKILDAHSGLITVSSAPGEGSRFDIKLPGTIAK